jgi:hypothetical protein
MMNEWQLLFSLFPDLWIPKPLPRVHADYGRPSEPPLKQPEPIHSRRTPLFLALSIHLSRPTRQELTSITHLQLQYVSWILTSRQPASEELKVPLGCGVIVCIIINPQRSMTDPRALPTTLTYIRGALHEAINRTLIRSRF